MREGLWGRPIVVESSWLSWNALEALLNTCGHHHPDYQHDTVEAITAKPKQRLSRAQPVHRMTVNKTR